jgi:hypothetical protein
MTCMTPTALAGETVRMSKSDSTEAWARASRGSTPIFAAASRTISRIFAAEGVETPSKEARFRFAAAFTSSEYV